MDMPILKKPSHASRFSARLKSDILKQNADTTAEKQHIKPVGLPTIPQKTQSDEHKYPVSISPPPPSTLVPACKSAFTQAEINNESSLPMPTGKPPRFPSNTSINSMGSTDSSGITSPFSLSPFSLYSDEFWADNSSDGMSSRASSTQPSNDSQASAALALSRSSSKSTGQLDSLPRILSSRNKNRQRALAGSPLAFEAHTDSPRPNSRVLKNLDKLKKSVSLPLDIDQKDTTLGLSDIKFTLGKPVRNRGMTLTDLYADEPKATPRLDALPDLSFLRAPSAANAFSAASDDTKAFGPS